MERSGQPLDKATALAGLANFQTTGEDGISGGIPGGTGAKENASELGQLAYIALSVISVADLAKAAWSLAKVVVGAIGSAFRTIAGRIAADRAMKQIATEVAKEQNN